MPLAEWGEAADGRSVGESARSDSSRASKEMRALRSGLELELAAASVPPVVAAAMAASNIGLGVARERGAAWMAAFLAEAEVHLSPCFTTLVAEIFTAVPPPPPILLLPTPPPLAPPPPPGPVVASRVSNTPPERGPEIAAQIPSSGLGVPVAPLLQSSSETKRAAAVADQAVLQARQVWLFAPCARKSCKCAAAYNGLEEQYCCTPCREGTACSDGRHSAPSEPDELMAGRTLQPMPTSLEYGIFLLLRRGLTLPDDAGLQEAITMLYAWQCDDAARHGFSSPRAELISASAAVVRASGLAAAAEAELSRRMSLHGAAPGQPCVDSHAAHVRTAPSAPPLPTPPGPPLASTWGGAELSTFELEVVTRCKEDAIGMEGELGAMLELVPDSKLPYVLRSFARMYEPTRGMVTDSASDYMQFEGMIPMLQAMVQATFRDIGQSSLEAMRQGGKGPPDPARRVVMALSVAVAGSKTSSRSGGGGWASGRSDAPPVQQDALRAAASALAAEPSAQKACAKVVQMAKDAGADEAKTKAMLAALNTALLDPAYGADLALLLGQEKLTQPPAGLPAMTCSVWHMVLELRVRLPPARVIKFEALLPRSVNALALVTAAGCGQLTMELICGQAKGRSAAEQRAAALRVWPVLIQLVRECFPRDADEATHGLLLVANDAFDRAKSDASTVKAITPVFEKMSLRFAHYASTGGAPPQWEKARYDTTVAKSEVQLVDIYLDAEEEPTAGKLASSFGLKDAAAKVAAAKAFEAQSLKVKQAAEAKVKTDAAAKGKLA